jgi:signal transduction histidine kinase
MPQLVPGSNGGKPQLIGAAARLFCPPFEPKSMKDPVKILMVDDDEEDFIIVRNLLAQLEGSRFSIEWAPSFEAGWELILANRHHVYLVDYRLGAEDGLELVRKAVHSGCDRPFILLTGMDDPALDEEAEAAGVADFLVKGSCGAQELARTLRYALAHANDMAKIKSLNASLEKRVAQRTQELENAKNAIEIALSQEKELNEMKSRFVSMASHEFRTPLTTIKTSASLIETYSEKKDFDRIKKHAERIGSAADNLNTILGEFLSLSKLEEGKVQASLKPTHIPQVVEDVASEMRHIFKPGQRFSYQHEGDEDFYLDGGLLKNVLINLISNAIKYSPEGAMIKVASSVSPHAATIAIQDEGIGISEADQAKLFTRFFRATNAGNVPGTGLGLHIVKRYVEMMNGEIGCESKLGSGSVFRVAFFGQNP